MSMFHFDGHINFDNAELEKMLNSPTGMVGRYMRRIGLEILIGAKAMAPVRTGNLKRSISMRQGLRGRVQYVEVGANTKYAYDVHEGTRRHTITARTGRLMRFNVGGRIVYARKVTHPGSRPKPYLTVPMNRVVR